MSQRFKDNPENLTPSENTELPVFDPDLGLDIDQRATILNLVKIVTEIFTSSEKSKLGLLNVLAQVPAGGGVDQVLGKASASDYDLDWQDSGNISKLPISLLFAYQLTQAVEVPFFGDGTIFSFEDPPNIPAELNTVTYFVRVDGGDFEQATDLNDVNNWLLNNPNDFLTLPAATPTTKWMLKVSALVSGSNDSGFILNQVFV